MTPFNPNAKCPKCGSDQITSQFKPAGTNHRYVKEEMRYEEYVVKPEQIDRRCVNCGYSWPEAPMDKETSE